MNKSESSLYDSKSKVFCFSEEGLDTVRREIADDGFFDLYRICASGKEDGLQAVDATGREHALHGPANGATVLLRDPGDADEPFDKVMDLWRRSGLDAPAALDTGASDRTMISRRVAESLVQQLEKELTQVSSNAIGLDKQIAVLREDLEDYRRNVEELQLVRRLAGEYPVLSFERKPSRSTARVGGDALTQLLPYGGNVMSAVGISLSNLRASEGALELRLVAREDDSTLASWTLEASALKDGWNCVSIGRRIPTRYRFVDVHVRWKGFEEHAPSVRLSDAYGDSEGFASAAGVPLQNQMLALKVWTGNRFDEEVAANHAHFSSDRDRLTASTHYQSVPEEMLKAVEGLTDPGKDRSWLRAAGNGVMVHPTSEGPSVAALDVSLTAPLTALTLSASVENPKSRPVSFRVVVVDAASDDHLTYARDPDLQGGDALHEGAWEEVLPCTELPLTCELAASVERAKILLMTKVVDGDESFAHAWFRNFQVAC